MDYHVIKLSVNNQLDRYLLELIEEILTHILDRFLEFLDYHNPIQEVMQVRVMNVDLTDNLIQFHVDHKHQMKLTKQKNKFIFPENNSSR